MGTLRQRATSLSPIYFKTKEKGWERCSTQIFGNGSRLPVVVYTGQSATACIKPIQRPLQ